MTQRSEETIAGDLRTWAVDVALPLWATVGVDATRGGFHEQLHPDGTPDVAAARRLRVQARQTYVYAHAAVLGWFPQGRELALRGVACMAEQYRSPDGRPGYVRHLSADGTPDPVRDTYDHTFVLLALAWTARASADAQVRGLLDEAIAFIDEHLTAADGSFIESIPKALPRRQNPHMHAFEAMLALHETIDYPDAMKRADALRALFGRAFYDPSTNSLAEYFTDAWERTPGADGDLVEPGHQAEWVWLIRKHERLAGLPNSPVARDLLASALRWKDGAGLLIDEANRDGSVRKTSRRTWPQTEFAKAWIAEAEIARLGAAANARAVLKGLADHYLDRPVQGGWIDQFDASGKPVYGPVLASTFYHVFCAITEADRVLCK